MGKLIQPYREGENQTEWMRRLVDALNDNLYPEDWHEVGATGEPAFGAGVSNVGGTNETAAFRLNNNHLSMKGRIQHSSNLNGATIFTLPLDNRPTNDVQIVITVFDGTGWKGGFLLVLATGAVIIHGIGTLTTASINTSFYLDN